MVSTRDILFDARTEVSLRLTAVLGLAYALFFYGPQGFVVWTLPVCLLAGAPSMIYNVGFHLYLGFGCSIALCIAGLLLSAILPLLKTGNIVAAYFALMAIVTFVAVPMLSYAGYMDNLNSLIVLLVLVLTESFFGPIRNASSTLGGTIDLFHYVIRGAYVSSLVFTVMAVGAFLIPPIHLGKKQTHGIMSGVLMGYAKILSDASNAVKARDSKTLVQLSATLFRQTNCAGLYTGISIFGGTALNEVNPFKICHSIPLDSYDVMGRMFDNCSLYITVFLNMFGVHSEDNDRNVEKSSAVNALRQTDDYLLIVADYLDSCSKLCTAIAEYLVDSSMVKKSTSTLVEKEDAISKAQRECEQSEQKLAKMSHNMNNIGRLLAWRSSRELISGQRFLSLIPRDTTLGPMSRSVIRCNAMNRGLLGRLAFVVQKSEQGRVHYTSIRGLLNNILRISFMERILYLVLEWCHSFLGLFDDKNLYSNPRVKKTRTRPWYRDRKTRRGLQLIIGTYGLYAVSTFWKEFSTLLGTSKSGQWTLLAFYVCFRATTEETVYASLNRMLGQVFGCLVSWGINSGVTSQGGRLACHISINAIAVWFVPPSAVYPSRIKFSFDNWLGHHILVGFLSSYHLTCTLVGFTTTFDAVKARMASQCIGSATAALLSATIFPWYTSKETPRTVREFRQDLPMLLASNDIEPYDIELRVKELLDASKDWSSANSQKEWVDDMLGTFHIIGKDKSRVDTEVSLANNAESPLLPDENENMDHLLIRVCIAGWALECYSRRLKELRDQELASSIRSAAAQSDLLSAQKVILEAITESNTVDSDEEDLADLLVLVTVIHDCDVIIKT